MVWLVSNHVTCGGTIKRQHVNRENEVSFIYLVLSIWYQEKPLLKHVCNPKSDATPVDTLQCLQAHPSLLPLLDPFLHPSYAPFNLPPHICALFIFPVTTPVPCDLYVYGHYWRWLIHSVFPLFSALFWQSSWVLWGITITFSLLDHSLLLPLVAPL